MLQPLLKHSHLRLGLGIGRFELGDARTSGRRLLRKVSVPVEVCPGFAEHGASAIELSHRRADFFHARPRIDQRGLGAGASQICLSRQQNRELGRVVENRDQRPLCDEVSAIKANLSKLATHSKAKMAIIVLDDPLVAGRRVALSAATRDRHDDDRDRQRPGPGCRKAHASERSRSGRVRALVLYRDWR